MFQAARFGLCVPADYLHARPQRVDWLASGITAVVVWVSD